MSLFNENSIKLLHASIKNDDLAIVETLIKRGVNVDLKNHEGYTPLQQAVLLKNEDIAKLLLKYKADPNITSKYRDTALHYAVKNCHHSLIETLIDYGADVNMQGWNGFTALHTAVERNDETVIEYLLFCGAEVDSARDNYSRTPLHWAADNSVSDDKLRVIQMLLINGADVNKKNVYDETPLHCLVRKPNVQTVKLFLDYGVDYNFKDYRGVTPLIEAIYADNDEVVQLLLDHGGPTPLVEAIKTNDVEAVELLINCGANVNASTEDGSTSLHLACEKCRGKIIKCLLKDGARVDALDFQRRTPLMRALSSWNKVDFFKISSRSEIHMKTLIFLLKYSDVNAVDTYDQNILSISSNKQMCEIILEHLAKLLQLNGSLISSLLKTIMNRVDHADYFKKCIKELIVAKNTRVCNSKITAFNLLVENKRKLKNLAGNEDLIEDIQVNHYENKFPIYGALMIKNVIKGIKRRQLFDTSVELLSNYLPVFDSTHLILEDILDCVISTKDLLKFCE